MLISERLLSGAAVGTVDVNVGERLHGGGRQLRQLRGGRPLPLRAHHGRKLPHGRRPFFYGEAAGETPRNFLPENYFHLALARPTLSPSRLECVALDRCFVGWTVRGRGCPFALPLDRVAEKLDLHG